MHGNSIALTLWNYVELGHETSFSLLALKTEVVSIMGTDFYMILEIFYHYEDSIVRGSAHLSLAQDDMDNPVLVR